MKKISFSAEKQQSKDVISREDGAVEALYAHYALVYRRCRDILRSEEDARDAAHDVFERLLRLDADGRLVIRSEEGPKALLSAMAATTSLDEIRRKRKDALKLYGAATNASLSRLKDLSGGEVWDLLRTHDFGEGACSPCTHGEHARGEYEQIEANLLVQGLLREEDEKTRAIIYMRYYDGMTYEEIGEVVGLKKSAVESRQKKFEERARVKLGKDKR